MLEKIPDRVRLRGKRAVNFEMPADLHEKLVAQAEKETRSVGGQIVHYLKAALSQEERK